MSKITKITGYTTRLPADVVDKDRLRIVVSADPFLCTGHRRWDCRRRGECIEYKENDPQSCSKYILTVEGTDD